MSRAARKKSKLGIYYVMLRGINRQVIFEEGEDREKFLQVLKDCKEKSAIVKMENPSKRLMISLM